MSSQIVLRLIAAAVLSSVIGLERQLHGKSAGLRTHALVGLGSALVMIVSQTGFNAVISPGRIVLDPSRVAAQVVSGVGFLGAGLIIVHHDIVRGLTTAAGIWVCSAIGLACGSGLVAVAGAVTGLSLLLIYIYAWVERVWMQPFSAEATIRVVCGDQPDLLEGITHTLEQGASGVHLVGVKRVEERPGYVAYEFHTRNRLLFQTVASSLMKTKGVLSVRTDAAPQDHDVPA